jgi:hypothetical protein
MLARTIMNAEKFEKLSTDEKLQALHCLTHSTGWPHASNTREVLFEFDSVYVTASLDESECKVVELNFFQAGESRSGIFWKVLQIVP